jgi:hypothetical protein
MYLVPFPDQQNGSASQIHVSIWPQELSMSISVSNPESSLSLLLKVQVLPYAKSWSPLTVLVFWSITLLKDLWLEVPPLLPSALCSKSLCQFSHSAKCDCFPPFFLLVHSAAWVLLLLDSEQVPICPRSAWSLLFGHTSHKLTLVPC